ncbi:unnamed protein product [Fusarium graminearum]|nr:unnamed protein product [Fusarium graminearum]
MKQIKSFLQGKQVLVKGNLKPGGVCIMRPSMAHSVCTLHSALCTLHSPNFGFKAKEWSTVIAMRYQPPQMTQFVVSIIDLTG